MRQKMTLTGAGPKILAFALPFVAAVIYANMHWKKIFMIPVAYAILYWTGLPCIIAGLIVNFASARSMVNAVRDGKLLTTGFYGVCRNPMYASFVLLTIPGCALVCGCWLIVIISPVVYAGVCLFVPAEEKLLTEHFGQSYLDYKARVRRIL